METTKDNSERELRRHGLTAFAWKSAITTDGVHGGTLAIISHARAYFRKSFFRRQDSDRASLRYLPEISFHILLISFYLSTFSSNAQH